MKTITILTLVLFFLAGRSQRKYSDDEIIGNYIYNKQEIKRAKAYFTITLKLFKNKTFVYCSASHILGGSSEHKGTWEKHKDILVLTNEDKSIDKYLISKKGLIKIPKSRNSIFLKKSNNQKTV